MSQLSENKSRHFLNSTFWKEKMSKNNDVNTVLIPYDLFNDDYENDNPIGSKNGEQSLSAFYITLPCLPSTKAFSWEN